MLLLISLFGFRCNADMTLDASNLAAMFASHDIEPVLGDFTAIPTGSADAFPRLNVYCTRLPKLHVSQDCLCELSLAIVS